MKVIALLAMSLAAVAQTTNWMAEAGEPLSDAQVAYYLDHVGGKGLLLFDVQQGFGNLANAMNTQNPSAVRSNHSGFSVRLLEPSAWLDRQKALAEKKFLPYTFANTTPFDRLQVLRVVVNADMPQYVVGNHGNNVAHVVLRSTSRSMIAQPINIQPFEQGAENDFGATVSRAGAVAMFKMVDLEQIRGQDINREFLVTVVGAGHVKGRSYDRDFRVKRKHFQALGDSE